MAGISVVLVACRIQMAALRVDVMPL